MKFSYAWLKEFAKLKESPEALAEFLTLRAFEVETIAKTGKDWALDIKLLPNRAADASGHVGMAREIAALKNSKFAAPTTKITEAKEPAKNAVGVRIENKTDCPRYTARVMRGVKVGPSPAWLRERLETCGIQSISNVVDAANFVMLELGQPLHAFDAKKLNGGITVRRAKQGEKLEALDDKTYALNPEILVIADDAGAIAIAGIKGGKASGVHQGTTDLVLESANFDPVRIRIASQRLNLKTDASWRFERGQDPNQTALAVDRLAALIQNIAGGDILTGRADQYPAPAKPKTILLRAAYLERLSGMVIPARFIANALGRIGCRIKKQSKDGWMIEAPTQRQDLAIEEDLIEEIVRLWGYDKIKAVAPRIPLAPSPLAEEEAESRQWRERVRDLFVAAGFTENYQYHFTGEKLLAAFGVSAERLLELENPASAEFTHLANHPAHRLVWHAAENLRHAERVALFAVTKGFERRDNPTPAKPADETSYLAAVIATKQDRTPRQEEAFLGLKGALDEVLERLGIADHWYDDALTVGERAAFPAMHPYRAAKIMAGEQAVGMFAELHPDVAERLKLKGRAAFAQIRLDALARAAEEEYSFTAPPKFPAVVRDLAVVVPSDVRADDVEEIIQAAGGKLLADTDLFDYFESDELAAEGKKSLAFHLVFQSPERTLTDAEVSKALAAISAVLTEKDWEMRT
ncbi:phenylalanine--tRNA ligase subunit beta [Candidatus Parcubacteria bacterium]|nr:MAG: phenylalanine--tRNA ligase subunit beta [Candidatus Parcubacteria bacterium]